MENSTIKLIFVCVLSALCSCTKIGGDAGMHPIEFYAPDYNLELKAQQLDSVKLIDFGVHASIQEQGQRSSFMNNTKVRKQANSALWTAEPKYYWPLLDDKTLDFFAYAPYSTSSNGIKTWADWSSRSISIAYTPNSNPANQVDLCVAPAVLDRRRLDAQGKESSVSFDFEHTLSYISFSANYIGTLPDDCKLRIDELSLNNLVATDTLVVSSSRTNYFAWKQYSLARKTASYVMSTTAGTLVANENKYPIVHQNQGFTDFVEPSGIILALPQEINSNDGSVRTVLDVTFSYVKGNSLIAQFYTSIPLSNLEWMPATKYRYLLTLNLTDASLILTGCYSSGWIEDWKPGNNHGDTLIK